MAAMVLLDLSKGDRTKIKTLITIEVHARDIVVKLINDKVTVQGAFAWQSQLKYRRDEERKDCFINICDAEFRYSYEYTGNCGRLVITNLTDYYAWENNGRKWNGLKRADGDGHTAGAFGSGGFW